MQKISGKVLIFLGVASCVYAGFLIWQRNTPTRLAFAKKPEFNTVDTTISIPSELIINDIQIRIPIISTKNETAEWETTPHGVSYLTSTVLPGKQGNSVLYGHNWPNLLGSLHKARPGMSLEVKFADGSMKQFQIKYMQTVKPNQTEILENSTDVRITVYTCTGFLDGERLVVVAISKEEVAHL